MLGAVSRSYETIVRGQEMTKGMEFVENTPIPKVNDMNEYTIITIEVCRKGYGLDRNPYGKSESGFLLWMDDYATLKTCQQGGFAMDQEERGLLIHRAYREDLLKKAGLWDEAKRSRYDFLISMPKEVPS
jgi:hypothetical protein